jgi:hypothetical protein
MRDLVRKAAKESLLLYPSHKKVLLACEMYMAAIFESALLISRHNLRMSRFAKASFKFCIPLYI